MKCWQCWRQSRISRTPYPPLGGGTLSQGAQNSVPSPLNTPEKIRSPKLKYEALEISEIRGPFERKVLMHALQLLLGHFESMVLYTLQLPRGARGKCLACLPLNTTLTMILYENMKPIEHVLLHPICVLSHLMCACKHCNVKLSSYYWTHWSCWWIYHFKKQISLDFS